MDKKFFQQESEFYCDQLVNNIIPFWLKHARDDECGGYITCLDRDGSPFDYDKLCTWAQGRVMWTFAYLYNNFRREQAWLDMALHGVEFMRKYGFDGETGRLYFSLSREGKPLAKSRDVFAELSLASGLSECSKAAGDKELLELAKKCVFTVTEVVKNPRTNPHRRFMSANRPTSMNAEYMILLNTVQGLRAMDNDRRYDEITGFCLDQIFSLHYSKNNCCFFEAVKLESGSLPGEMDRWINPGHMMELGWFLIHEGQYRSDEEIIDKGIEAIDWGMEWGWDTEYGGIFNDVDIEGCCIVGPNFYNMPMKLWWSVLEALYANVLAYQVTGDEKFLNNYKKVKEWSFEHFADDEYGEWYAYLSPEGKDVGGGAKGSERKNSFHIGRAFYLCYKKFGELADERS